MKANKQLQRIFGEKFAFCQAELRNLSLPDSPAPSWSMKCETVAEWKDRHIPSIQRITKET